MRVIAGQARGVTLHTPPGQQVRPTLDRVRESLFSILMPRLPGCRFLDLFAGTGANGIEALSRGAAWAAFVEEDVAVSKILDANLDRTRLADRAKTYRVTLPEGLRAVARREEPFDIAFADPPYAFRDFVGFMILLRENALLAEEAVVVLEHGAQCAVETDLAGFTCFRTCRYGNVALSFFS